MATTLPSAGACGRVLGQNRRTGLVGLYGTQHDLTGIRDFGPRMCIRPIPPGRSSAMSSIESAPATIPATSGDPQPQVRAVASREGSVALFERKPCRAGSGPLCWSDGGSEFVECGGQPERLRGVDCELVVATAEVLDERVAPDHHARRSIRLHPAQRPESGLEPAVVAFDTVVRIGRCDATQQESSPRSRSPTPVPGR